MNRVQMAVIGAPPELFRAAIPDILEELQERDYLGNPRVWWEPRAERIVVEVGYAGEPEPASLAVHDDLSDTIFATVSGDWERFRIVPIDAQPVLDQKG